MKKKGLIVTLVMLFLVALTGSVFAWSGKADVSGKPDEFSQRDKTGYYVWQDNEGFHIWTTTRGEGHIFSGIIRTNGKLSNIRGSSLEKADSFKKTDHKENSWFDGDRRNHGNRFAVGRHDVKYEKDQIRFKFDTDGTADGLNFRVNGADYVEFDLYMDGHPINHRAIHIGEESWHPYSNNFRISK